MPLIMDDDQYMDDLFGDNEPMQLPSPVNVKGLPQRLDELRRSGCCQKLAWSNYNSVASITADGRGIELRSLVRKPGEGKWTLSDAVPLKLPPSHDDSQFVHLSWSSVGSDLVIIDAAGRILIFFIGYALGKMQLAKAASVDQNDELSAIVGMHWLPVFPLHQRFSRFRSATYTGNAWTYRISQHMSPGPSHPQEGKSALIYIARNGVLNLCYQQVDGRWTEVRTELDTMTSVKSLFTHASFGADVDGSLVLATCDIHGELQVFRLRIHWKPPPNAKGMGGGMIDATLDVQFVGNYGRCSLLQQPHDIDSAESKFGQRDPMLTQLSHLEILPAPPEQGPRAFQNLTILAISSYLPETANALEQAQLHPEAFTMVVACELVSQDQRLHPSFAQLASKKKSNGASVKKQFIFVKPRNDIVLDGVVTAVSSPLNHTMIAFTFGDGSIQFHSHPSLEVITPSFDHQTVFSMPQSGFAFAANNPCLYSALSPNFCATAIRQPDGGVSVKYMEYTLGSLSSAENDSKLSAAIVALAMQHTSSCWRYHSSDDIFAAIGQDINPRWIHEFLTLAYQMLNTSVDYVSEDSQKQAHALFRITPILKCLSAQALFGSKDGRHRNVPGKFAWIALNIRLSFLSMGASMKDPWTPEATLSLTGTVRWSLDLMVYVVDDLIRLSRAVQGSENNRAVIQQKLTEMVSPALLLVLTSVTRILIRYLCRHLRQVLQLTGTAIKKATSLEHRQSYSSFFNFFSNCPITLYTMDPLLGEMDSMVKTAYVKAGVSDVERGRIEKAMLTSCEIPEVLMPAVKTLLTSTLDRFQDEVDPAKLYFADVRWLGLTEDRATEDYQSRHRFDAVRKVELKKGARLRRCTRCCAYMLDFDTREAKSLSLWTHGAQKVCVCGSSWVSIGSESDEIVDQETKK